MNPSAYRKVAYMAALVALLFPMAWLGSPSSRGGPGEPDDPGGKLAQLRSEAKLGQGDLGAIDPASETMRMATLGLRGPAVTMLWNKANEYKKTEDWTAFQATLEQLARLQPYFVKVWQYQAWNLSYNVSVELDNVRDRFYYVKQGIEYLEKGIVYLRDNPTLLDDLGWFCGNKVGRADEHLLYRQMFKRDDELHPADLPMADRDNWLVSRRWYELAISAIDDKKQPLGTKNPVTFFDSPARSQMSYAEAIQEEGVLLNLWKSAWQEGARLWTEYGDRKMRSTTGLEISLGEQETLEAKGQDLSAQLDALSPGLLAKMRAEVEASLTPHQKKMLASPPLEPTEEESKLQMAASDAMDITPMEIADRIAHDRPEQAADARRIAAEIADNTERINSISTNRDVANYAYWRIRCGIEQTDEALEARTLTHAAETAFKKGDLDGAQEKYEKSFVLWDQALAKFPELDADSTFGDDLMDFVGAYVKVLEQLDLSLEDRDVADRFALWRIVEANDNERKYTAALTARDERRTGMPADTKPLINPSEGFVQ
jgi:hypothetical protein